MLVWYKTDTDIWFILFISAHICKLVLCQTWMYWQRSTIFSYFYILLLFCLSVLPFSVPFCVLFLPIWAWIANISGEFYLIGTFFPLGDECEQTDISDLCWCFFNWVIFAYCLDLSFSAFTTLCSGQATLWYFPEKTVNANKGTQRALLAWWYEK